MRLSPGSVFESGQSPYRAETYSASRLNPPEFDYQRHGWWEFGTSIGDRVEATNKEGLTFNQLYEKYGDDYKIPVFGARSPKENLIIVGGGGADESIWHIHILGGRGRAVNIDRWR